MDEERKIGRRKIEWKRRKEGKNQGKKRERRQESRRKRRK